MRKEGFAFISVILVGFFILTFSSMYIIYLTRLESGMVFASRDKIQSKYYSESKINRVVHDDIYFESLLNPFIINHLRYPLTAPSYLNIVLNSEHLVEDDEAKVVRTDIYSADSRKEIKVAAESNYKGIKTSVSKHFSVINDLFEVGKLPLISYELDFDTCDKLFQFYNGLDEGLILDIIPSNYKLINTFDHEKIVVKTKNSTTNLVTKIRNGFSVSEEYNKVTYKDIILVIKNNIFRPIELEIEESNYKDPLTLNGIIYLEGDLIISGRFKFNGIIILKGDDSKIIVNTDTKPLIKGIILTEGDTDFIDSIELKYVSDYIYKYGIYLPGFVELK